MADTVIGPNAHTRIVMRKYDIATRGSDNKMPAVNEISIFPNPFRHQTNIHFEILKKARVNVWVYNIKGELQTTLISAEKEPGKIELNWDGTDSNGKRVSPGLYIVRVQATNWSYSKKIELIR
jgi:flagellar hook assembly protein FlgD